MKHKIKNCGGALIIFKNNTENPTVVSETCMYIDTSKIQYLCLNNLPWEMVIYACIFLGNCKLILV